MSTARVYDIAPVPDRLKGERLERKLIAQRRLSFGVKFLDDSLGGIFPHDVILLGAASGVGKTQLAAVIAQGNAAKGKRVVFLALEAEPREIERRMKYRALAGMYYRERVGSSTRLSYRGWYMGQHTAELGALEDRAEAEVAASFKSMRTLYKSGHFGATDLVSVIESVHREGGADLVILDHLHYVDSPDDKTENAAQKSLVQAIRDTGISTGIPIIVVAHLRKADRFGKRLVPMLDDFHGSSDIAKVATKAILLAPAPDDPGVGGYAWSTYVSCPKERMDGGTKNFVGLLTFDARRGEYLDGYTLGRLTDGGETWTELEASECPAWADRRRT